MRRRYVFAAASLTCAVAGDALALEYCVTCEGPPSMYRCVIDGTPEGPGKDSNASLYCISELAAKGRHESCSVSRGAPFPCPGLTAVVKQPKQPTLAAPPPVPGSETGTAEGLDAAHPAKAAEEPPPAQKPAKVPRTVQELAGETVKSSQEGLHKAGEAIGGTAKKAGEQIGSAGSAIGNAATKTWTCITSLFSACGSSTETATDEHPSDAPAAN